MGLEDQVSWDEDDVILFSWGNTTAAKERHHNKVHETNRRIKAWTEWVDSDSDWHTQFDANRSTVLPCLVILYYQLHPHGKNLLRLRFLSLPF